MYLRYNQDYSVRQLCTCRCQNIAHLSPLITLACVRATDSKCTCLFLLYYAICLLVIRHNVSVWLCDLSVHCLEFDFCKDFLCLWIHSRFELLILSQVKSVQMMLYAINIVYVLVMTSWIKDGVAHLVECLTCKRSLMNVKPHQRLTRRFLEQETLPSLLITG